MSLRLRRMQRVTVSPTILRVGRPLEDAHTCVKTPECVTATVFELKLQILSQTA